MISSLKTFARSVPGVRLNCRGLVQQSVIPHLRPLQKVKLCGSGKFCRALSLTAQWCMTRAPDEVNFPLPLQPSALPFLYSCSYSLPLVAVGIDGCSDRSLASEDEIGVVASAGFQCIPFIVPRRHGDDHKFPRNADLRRCRGDDAG